MLSGSCVFVAWTIQVRELFPRILLSYGSDYLHTLPYRLVSTAVRVVRL